MPKFNEDPPRDKGDIEQAPNSRLKLVTFNFDLALESAWLSLISMWRIFDQSLKKIFPEIKEVHKIQAQT